MERESVTLPFAFPLYCTEYHAVDVTSHGTLEFEGVGVVGVPATNDAIPSAFLQSGGLIAAFWQVLTTSSSSMFLEWRSDTEVSLQWTDWVPTSWMTEEDSFITVQVSLFRNGSIVLSYLSLRGRGSAGDVASIGVQGGNQGVGLSYFSPTLSSGLCFHLFPSESVCDAYVVETFECPEKQLLVAKCPPGRYLGSNFLCSECSAGSYQTGEGMVGEGSCIPCAAGKFSLSTGAASEESCVAANGTELSVDVNLRHETLAEPALQGESPMVTRCLSLIKLAKILLSLINLDIDLYYLCLNYLTFL
jgi:hypothetical protein